MAGPFPILYPQRLYPHILKPSNGIVGITIAEKNLRIGLAIIVDNEYFQ